MAIELSEVTKLTALARLDLNTSEQERLRHELGDILNYVKKVKELASQVTNDPESRGSGLRADQIKDFLVDNRLLIDDKTDRNRLIKAPPVFG